MQCYVPTYPPTSKPLWTHNGQGVTACYYDGSVAFRSFDNDLILARMRNGMTNTYGNSYLDSGLSVGWLSLWSWTDYERSH